MKTTETRVILDVGYEEISSDHVVTRLCEETVIVVAPEDCPPQVRTI